MQKLFPFIAFIIASIVVLRLVVFVHTVVADVPIEPLLAEGGVTVFLAFYFSVAILGGAIALTLAGMTPRRVFGVGVMNLVVLAVVVELYVITVEQFESAFAPLVAAFVGTAILLVVFFRNALKESSERLGMNDQVERRSSGLPNSR